MWLAEEAALGAWTVMSVCLPWSAKTSTNPRPGLTGIAPSTVSQDNTEHSREILFHFFLTSSTRASGISTSSPPITTLMRGEAEWLESVIPLLKKERR